jgi:UDP-2,3-diacylglucosamine hydrolase
MKTAAPKIFFISDLHLSENVPQVVELFNHFINAIFKPHDQLFILGDFFEYYLGADLLDSAQLQALQSLRHLVKQGSKIYFMPGNRDFLICAETLAQYGVELLQDPSLLTLANQKVLLAHGDTLCTDDVQYQRYRKLAHLGLTQSLFLHLPKILRKCIANKIHRHNPHKTKLNDPNYTLADATPTAIENLLARYRPDLLIYGHVHKMGEYHHGKIKRLVLGDWYHTGNYLTLTNTGVAAQVFELA